MKSGFFFLAGMADAQTAELVLTADGVITNIVFAEELVNAAPPITGWMFTALKPALDIKNVSITMANYSFTAENLFFYADDIPDCPDEIDIKVIHADFNEADENTIINGSLIFLDNFLGELNFVTTIDAIAVIGKEQAEKELIPIEKLKPYLIWREKEFVEKYGDLQYNPANDSFAALEAKLSNGAPMLAIINIGLLGWEGKASHPWILDVEIKYNGENNNGMPDNETYRLLDDIEDDILAQLNDADAYLNIGRQTADNAREIYIACNDFRKSSKVMYALKQKYAGLLNLGYKVYKDKYWRSFNRFVN
ncbi:DUF695 domain-containing protein [Mucilaginibacter paludis]|uniref:DUF695 domain-containing protein n=1 Tax=Mucilaginibacter paludis DSM 18603 TaxID=714943 RepID=H1YGG5_9SPHI|nr:DUF695 domain-containing protein [Mucilaginibacter paludis]EHQ24517.1 hypothetical protein Mucpa_0321 [Mucilaginibacter paludis DSM 18603]